MEEGGSPSPHPNLPCLVATLPPKSPGAIRLRETKVQANGVLGQGPGCHRSPVQPTPSLPPFHHSCCRGREDILEEEKAMTSSTYFLKMETDLGGQGLCGTWDAQVTYNQRKLGSSVSTPGPVDSGPGAWRWVSWETGTRECGGSP